MTATKDSWKCEPFIQGVPISYARLFSRDEFAKIQQGLVPDDMDDKWFIYFDEYLYFHQSWTGMPVFRVSFVGHGDDVGVAEALCTQGTLDRFEPGYPAELLKFLIANLLLGEQTAFPVPKEDKGPPGAFQHSIAGSGFRERRFDFRLKKNET